MSLQCEHCGEEHEYFEEYEELMPLDLLPVNVLIILKDHNFDFGTVIGETEHLKAVIFEEVEIDVEVIVTPEITNDPMYS